MPGWRHVMKDLLPVKPAFRDYSMIATVTKESTGDSVKEVIYITSGRPAETIHSVVLHQEFDF